MTLVTLPSYSKFRAKRTNGYASKREAKMASDLKILADAGTITALQEQVSYTLLPAMPPDFPRPLRYIADFVYLDNYHVQHVVDCKGFKTDVYKIKKRLMKQLLGIDVEEV